MKKLEIWTEGKPHLKGSIQMNSPRLRRHRRYYLVFSHDLTNLFSSSHRGYYCQTWAVKTTPL